MCSTSDVRQLVEESQELVRKGEIAGALKKARLAFSLAQASGNPEELALVHACEGQVYYRSGVFEGARDLARRALSLANPESTVYVDALNLLGMCANDTDDLNTAEDCFRNAIEISRLQGYHQGLARALHNLSAGVYTPRGQFELALSADEEALRIAVEHGWSDPILPRLTIAWIFWITGRIFRFEGALSDLEADAGQNSLADGYYRLFLANLELSRGNFAPALKNYQLARSLGEEIGDMGLNVEARLGLSRYYRLSGEPVIACSWATDAVAVARHAHSLYAESMALVELGRVHWEVGDASAAEMDFRAAVEVSGRYQAYFYQTCAFFLLVALLQRQGHPEAPRIWSDTMQRIARGDWFFLLDQDRKLAYPLLAYYLKHPNKRLVGASAELLSQLGRVPPPPLKIVTLGGYEVWVGNRRIDPAALRQRHSGELLALLLISPGHRLEFEQVAEALCPEKEPVSARHFFQHAVSTLRRLLEPELPDATFPSRFLEMEQGQLILRVASETRLDFQVFQDLCSQKSWEAALGIYRGSFLPEYRYCEWALRLREHLAELYRRALLSVADMRLTDRDWERALTLSQQALVEDPWDERAARIGIQACLASGDPTGAIRIYQKLEKVLHADLGVEPEDDLRHLYQTIKKMPPTRN